jgi:hypothetical protein
MRLLWKRVMFAYLLNGTINPNGLTTTYYFEWGTTTAYGNRSPAIPTSADSGWGNIAGSVNLTELTPNVVYHYRLVATNSLGTTYGSDMTVLQIGTVVIYPEPAAMNATAPWTLSGPNNYTWTGTGDLTINNLVLGNYTIIWGDVSGWIKPSPATETKALSNGGMTTFNGLYVHQTIPIIQVTPISLNFGYVPVGSTKDLFLTVKNTGGGTLKGNATTTLPFSIVSGGSYSLGDDQSQVVTIHYQPTSSGVHTSVVAYTGGSGAVVPVTGKTEKPSVVPSMLLLLLGN